MCLIKDGTKTSRPSHLFTRPYPIRQLVTEAGVFFLGLLFLFCGGHHIEGDFVSNVGSLTAFLVIELFSGHVDAALSCGVELGCSLELWI